MMGFPFVGILRTAGDVLGADRHSGRSDRSGENRRRQILPHYPGDSPAAAGRAIQALIVLALIGIIQDFGSILIVTGGACRFDLRAGAQMYFAATKFNDLGYASALGVSMFAIIMVITVINMKFIKTNTD